MKNLLLNKDEIQIVNNLIWSEPVQEVANKIGCSLMALHYYLKNRDNYPPSPTSQQHTLHVQSAQSTQNNKQLQHKQQHQQQQQQQLSHNHQQQQHQQQQHHHHHHHNNHHHHQHHLHQPYSTFAHHQHQQYHQTSSGGSSAGGSSNTTTTTATTSGSNSSTGIGGFSGTTIGPIRNNANTTVTKKPKTEPILTQFYQTERLNFANSHLVWSEEHWKRVVFQDERKFNLDGPDGFSYYYHDLRNYERSLSQRPRGGSVYIWFMITSGGPIVCEVSTTRLKPSAYLEVLLRERAKIVEKLGGNSDFVLQDHNWSCNSMLSTQNWLNSEGIKVQKWPYVAHDLNIIENIWGWLIREVYDGGRKYSRKDDLIFAIRNAWTKLPIDLIQNLYSTLPERITELFYTQGVYTNC